MHTATYKYKVYKQNDNHRRKLEKMLSYCRAVYNHTIALNRRFYSLYGKSASEFDMKKHFTKLKKRDHKEWNDISSQTIQCIIERIYESYVRFFRHTAKRPPSFKGKNKYSYIPFKKYGWNLNANTLTINKCGLKLRFKLSRPLDGEIKTITLKRDKVGDWWVFFVVCMGHGEITERVTTGRAAGLDFGLLHFLTLDDGTTVDAPLPLKSTLKELKLKSRKFSKKLKDSNNRQKARIELARLHRRITNQRNDFQWKLAVDFTKEYDIICIEDLNISVMRKRWGRKFSDLAYNSFVQKLEWECAKHFKELVRVDRFEPTSKVCSCYGHKEETMPLKVREWVCTECGCVHDRDVNAARNILRAGASALGRGDVRRTWSAVPVEARI